MYLNSCIINYARTHIHGILFRGIRDTGMKTYIISLIIIFSLGGCSSNAGILGALGMSGQNSGTGEPSPASGSFQLTVRWAEAKKNQKYISVYTQSIDITVTGSDMSQPKSAIITKSAGETSAVCTINELPIGQKTATVKALNESGEILSHRIADFVVRGGKVTTVDIDLGVSIKENELIPSNISVPAGTTLLWVNNANDAKFISGDYPFDNSQLPRGSGKSYSFDKVGTSSYQCGNLTGNVYVTGTPVISVISPASASIGDKVTITGTAFSAYEGSNTVTFAGIVAQVSSWGNTQIVCTVPGGAKSGDVVITVNNRAGSGYSFTVTPVSTPSFSLQWGSYGGANGQFNFPYGIAVKEDYIYVSDTGGFRMQKFNSTGNYIHKWGSLGSGNDQFQSPTGVTVDGSGYIYVADYNLCRITKFDSSGIYQTSWGAQGIQNGQLQNPMGLSSDSYNNIYVADYGNHRIQKFNSNGVYLDKFGTEGTGNGKFQWPYDVAVNNEGYIYVSDSNNHRICKFNSSFNFELSWGSHGENPGQFKYPDGLAIDSYGRVYVADHGNHRIQKFSPDGVYLTSFGSFGHGSGKFYYPYDICIDVSTNNIYIMDSFNNLVQKFII